MIGKRQKKMFSLVSILALVLSLFAPYTSAASEGAITVAEAIANNTGTATVEGYIVGTTSNGPTYKHEGPFTVASNLAIADSANETDPSKIMPVQLPSGSAVRADLNLIDHPDNLGKKVQITGTLEAYFTAPGLKSPTAYTFVEETDPTQVQAVAATPGAGAVEKGTEVSLSTSTEGATIHYTIDGTEPSADSNVYTEPIVINEQVTIKAIAVKEGLDNSEVSTFDYSILEQKTIAEIRAMQTGDSALTSGVVTAVLGSATYIQDETAGIVLYGPRLDVQLGDIVKASGQLTEYSTLLELDVQAEDVKVIGTANVPEAEVLKASQLLEDKEATLVKVEHVTVQSYSGGNYTAIDTEGNSFEIRPGDASWLETDTSYDSITGVLGAYGGKHQLIPRSTADIIADSTKVQPVTAAPGAGLVESGEQVSLATLTEGATIYFTTDGTEPTASSQVYSTPIEITENTTIKALAVKEGLTNSKVAAFNYIIEKEEVRIHDIQGAGHYSVYDGLNVSNVEGIVTKVVDKNNFYLQDLQPDENPKTSEGILVYKKDHGLTAGNVVSVTGQVKEWVLDGYSEKRETDLPVTEINATDIVTTASGQELPAPVVIGEDRIPPTEVIDNDSFSEFDPEQDGIDFYESLEGMLVQVNNPKVVAPQKYGELVVVPGNVETNTADGGLRIKEDDYNPERIHIDMNDESFVAKMGDRFNGHIMGVVSYGFSNYKVLSDKTDLPELIEGSNVREETTITAEEKKLTIASYNVENFSTKTDAEKVERLAEAIVQNMKQPDIVGLTEVQDNDGPTDSGTTDATESAALLIEKIKELGGPEYTYTDIAPVDKMDGGQPGGNIRVGFLYNAERVSLMEGTKGSATEAVEFEDGKLTLNPGRIDPTNEAFDDSRKALAAQFEFQGESVIVVANHFNSKGGDLPLFGKVQPPILNSEIQRMKIANIVNGFVKDVKEEDPDANVVLLGDFNDFEFSNPLEALKGEELTNMIEKVPAEERYTYTYQGNAQVLDHILVSNNLAKKTEVDILHINSGFMEEHGRASDHDPVLIQTDLRDLGKPETPKGPKFEKIYKLSYYYAKKLVVGPHDVLVIMDKTSKITEGIWLKKSAALKGEGLRDTKVIISSANKDAVYDFTGSGIKEVHIESDKVMEIKGSENVQLWTVAKGVNISHIIFKDSEGNVIPSPYVAASQFSFVG
jgi:predicted extracellular nuclease